MRIVTALPAESGKRLAFVNGMRTRFATLAAPIFGAMLAATALLPASAGAQRPLPFFGGEPAAPLSPLALALEKPRGPLGSAARMGRKRLARVDSAVALARAQLGYRYRRGGESPRFGFDCSGLVQYVMRALDIELPRVAREQARTGVAVARDTAALRPGDLLTFGRRGKVEHIGIYVGNGRFIHASTGAGRVVERPLLRPPARGIRPWLGVRRILPDSASLGMADSTARADSTVHGGG